MTNLPPPPPPPPPAAAVIQTGVNNANMVSPWARLGAHLLEGLLMTFTLGIGWIIWASMTAGTGQTPAKKLLNQRVVDANTLLPVSMGKMFWVRGLVAGLVASIAFPITLGILLFMPFWDKRNQNLWDKVSNTLVVNA
ncbi:unannotated protein [freshwater metagenome]|uniref:Unannotated protein n=1 Tax=freshwater metagenome TaxID=449393 RepID=A0A6J7D4U3_9ZZZZ